MSIAIYNKSPNALENEESNYKRIKLLRKKRLMPIIIDYSILI